MSILESIRCHQDLLQLNEQSRLKLCGEIRDFLVSRVSKTGGHLASNLGVVELSVAIETVFDTEKDRLVFDVGHQSYIHKMLTGRQADFDHLRQYDGMSGFPKPEESNTDAFVAGHASSSVSIALGMARARTLQKQDYQVVALIGDGAATGGVAYEGLNDAAVSGEPMVIILNDNAFSIDRNVGGMASHLSNLRSKTPYLNMKKRYRNALLKIPGGKYLYRFTRNIKDRIRRMLIPATIFESMGFQYIGPVDGHDTENLIDLLQFAKGMGCPVVVHVTTQKGRGYEPAQEHPKLFHGIGKFDKVTGEPLKKSGPTFSDAFGKTMVELAGENDGVCAITAAMPGGTGLLDFKAQYPKRLFDVGIAEEHAVSMAGGLAKQGLTPVVAIYSTFLQRAYDMILQDISLLGLHVVLAVDRAGLVGEDGQTHHGVFDVGYLRHAPKMTVLCPGSCLELQDMLRWAVQVHNGPVALRYPRGGDAGYRESAWNADADVAKDGLLYCHRMGKDVTIVTFGTLVESAMQAAQLLSEKGIEATVVRLLTVSPLPTQALARLLQDNATVVVMEETARSCGIAGPLFQELAAVCPGCRVYSKDLGQDFVPQGSMDQLYKHCGLDGESMAEYIQEVLSNEK